ncbi:MAG: hypothetical protein WKG06_22120 [Segetibacter sp.]
MLQNLINLVRNNASLLQSPSITPDRKEESVNLAGTSIFDGLKSVLSGGGVSTIMNFLKAVKPINQILLLKKFLQILSASFHRHLV